MIVFYVLVSVMPFIQHPLWSYFVGDLTLFKVAGVVCLVYAAGYLVVRPSPPKLFRTPQAWWTVAFLLAGVASALTLSGSAPFGESPLLRSLSFLLLFVITQIVVDSTERLRWVLLVAIGSMGYASLHIFREWQKYGGFAAGYRPGWITGDPNYFSLSALFCISFAFYLIRPGQPRWERYFCLGSLGLTLLALTLASSRGGLLGLIVSSLLVAWRSRRRLKVLALVCVLLFPLMVISPSSPLTRLLAPDRSDQEATDQRLALWTAGLRMVQSNPLTGIGVGNFKSLVRRYAAPGERLELHAHNTYVQIVAEMGIPVFLLFLGAVIGAFLSAGHVYHTATGPGSLFVRRAAAGIQTGLLGFAVAAFFVSADYHRLFWLVIFLSACLPALARGRARGRPSRMTSRKETASWHAREQVLDRVEPRRQP